MSEIETALAEEARRLVVDATYASRGHFAAAAGWVRWAVWLGAPVVVLTALSAGGAAAAVVADHNSAAAFLAVAAAILAALRGFLRPDELADAHSAKANRYVALRNEARFFAEIDLKSGRPVEMLQGQLRQLREDYNRLLTTPPHRVSRKNYETAKREIETGEASYTNDRLWPELGGTPPKS